MSTASVVKRVLLRVVSSDLSTHTESVASCDVVRTLLHTESVASCGVRSLLHTETVASCGVRSLLHIESAAKYHLHLMPAPSVLLQQQSY